MLEVFTQSLDRLQVGWTKTKAEALADVLVDVLVEPAVGAPLPFAGVSLEGAPVELRPTAAQLADARTGVTAASLAVASYGSLVLDQTPDAAEPASLFPALHVAVLRASDVVPDMKAAFARLGDRFRERPTSAVLATGPSATADMGALVRGAHGPRDVHVIILEDQ